MESSKPERPFVNNVYNLTRSPLTTALYYLNSNAWNRLHVIMSLRQRKKNKTKQNKNEQK